MYVFILLVATRLWRSHKYRINTNKFKHLYFIYMTVSEAHNGEAITTVGRGHK